MDDLKAFLTIARLQNFTKAAAELRVSQSALSYTIKTLEKKLDVKLLARTTRSVAPTAAGQQLFASLEPLYAQIEDELVKLENYRVQPTGTIRITGSDDAIQYLLKPVLPSFFNDYPEVNVELGIDYGLTDIIQERFDAGIRLESSINKNMIAVKISPDWRLSVVAAPEYFLKHPAPQEPAQLVNHNCINIRHSSKGGVYAWEFEENGKSSSLRVNGQLTSNSTIHNLDGALSGTGIAYLPQYVVEPYIESGQLVEILVDFCPYFGGFYLYYPHRRQDSYAFMSLVERLRYRE